MTERIPNYLRKLLADMRADPEKYKPGKVITTTVYHDDYCDYWTGGACNCSPDIDQSEYEREPKND